MSTKPHSHPWSNPGATAPPERAQGKANRPKRPGTHPVRGEDAFSRAVFQRRAQLPQAEETKPPLISPTHEKPQQHRATSASSPPPAAPRRQPPSVPVLPDAPRCRQPTLASWPRSATPQAPTWRDRTSSSCCKTSRLHESQRAPKTCAGIQAEAPADPRGFALLGEGGTPCKVISLCTFTLPATRLPPRSLTWSLIYLDRGKAVICLLAAPRKRRPAQECHAEQIPARCLLCQGSERDPRSGLDPSRSPRVSETTPSPEPVLPAALHPSTPPPTPAWRR